MNKNFIGKLIIIAITAFLLFVTYYGGWFAMGAAFVLGLIQYIDGYVDRANDCCTNRTKLKSFE
jgi:phosphatidylglycerophosphate synthase